MRSVFGLGDRNRRTIILLFLTMILISCTQPTSSSSNSSPTSSPTVTVPTSSPIVSVTQKVKSAKEAGIFIRSKEGLQCPLRTPYTGYDSEYGPQRLVLAEDRLAYNQSEVQQIRAYLGGSGKVQLPPTLRYVQGGSQCTIHLEITNITSGGLQINLAGVQLTGTPHPNNYQYRAIDTCASGGLCVAASGPGTCSVFGVTINLSPGMAISILAKPTNLQPQFIVLCSKLYLWPKDVVHFVISLTSTKPYVYPVVPILSVTNSQGSSFVTIPSMASTVAFITREQLSCYKLEGTQFVQEPLNPRSESTDCVFPDQNAV